MQLPEVVCVGLTVRVSSLPWQYPPGGSLLDIPSRSCYLAVVCME
jgi:hypothetical protein